MISVRRPTVNRVGGNFIVTLPEPSGLIVCHVCKQALAPDAFGKTPLGHRRSTCNHRRYVLHSDKRPQFCHSCQRMVRVPKYWRKDNPCPHCLDLAGTIDRAKLVTESISRLAIQVEIGHADKLAIIKFIQERIGC